MLVSMYNGMHSSAPYSLEGSAGYSLPGAVCVPPSPQLFNFSSVGSPVSQMAPPVMNSTATMATASWSSNSNTLSTAENTSQILAGFKFPGMSRDLSAPGMAGHLATTAPSGGTAAVPQGCFGSYGYTATTAPVMPWSCGTVPPISALQRGTYDLRECVQCGTPTQTCYPDGTGHFFCGTCFCSSKWRINQPRFLQARRGVSIHQSPYARRYHSMCTNCGTTQTTLWRRNSEGEPVCNACGLYYKLHGIRRPLSMRKDGIQTRKRKPKSRKKDDEKNKIKPEPGYSTNDSKSSVSLDPPSQKSQYPVNGNKPDTSSALYSYPNSTVLPSILNQSSSTNNNCTESADGATCSYTVNGGTTSSGQLQQYNVMSASCHPSGDAMLPRQTHLT